MPETYKTVAKEAADEFIEKKSRFIGYVLPVTTEAEALAAVAARKKKFWDAKHNVWAYTLRSGGARCSDDGEPQGTAGVPVLDVLQKAGIVDCVVVVTRYFGGVLLGAGGLVRAYSHAASLGVAAATPVLMRPCTVMTVTCDYSRYGGVQGLLASEGQLGETAFGEAVTLTVTLPDERVAATQAALTELSAGQLTLTETDRIYAAWQAEE